jgi:hypothetical protein
MSAPHQTSPSANGAGNLFVEADPTQRSAPTAPARSGTAQSPRRGRGLVIPVDQTPGRALSSPDAARFTRPSRGGRLAAGAHARLQAADARAAALLRRLAATRYGALVAAATVAAMLLALSWVGLALRDASTADHSAERARTAAVAALTREHTRIAALNTQLATATANARHSRRASATATAAAAAWRARAIAAEHKLAPNRHRPRH